MLCQLTPEEAYRTCVDETRRFVSETGFEDVIIGLSGGIDSCLVATIAVDALGASRVHGMLLPGPYSSESSLTDAEALAANLGIAAMTVSITGPYEAFAHALASVTGNALSGLASENTQARCRMVCIMAVSNAEDWMMLNTGNKSEAAMGYSTLYGDTAGAFAPIGGLYKSDVFELSRWRNRQAEEAGETAPIPMSVILKPPSAELAPNQSDESSMGVDYKTLDPILVAHVEHGEDADAIAEGGYAHSLVSGIIKRNASYAFKRALEPPFPRIAY